MPVTHEGPARGLRAPGVGSQALIPQLGWSSRGSAWVIWDLYHKTNKQTTKKGKTEKKKEKKKKYLQQSTLGEQYHLAAIAQ